MAGAVTVSERIVAVTEPVTVSERIVAVTVTVTVSERIVAVTELECADRQRGSATQKSMCCQGP